MKKKKTTQHRSASSLFDARLGKRGTKERDKLAIEAILENFNADLDDIPLGDLEAKLEKMKEMFSVIKTYRLKAGISQKELAEKTGMKHSYISRAEHGKSDIQLTSFFKILNALGLKFELTIA